MARTNQVSLWNGKICQSKREKKEEKNCGKSQDVTQIN